MVCDVWCVVRRVTVSVPQVGFNDDRERGPAFHAQPHYLLSTLCSICSSLVNQCTSRMPSPFSRPSACHDSHHTKHNTGHDNVNVNDNNNKKRWTLRQTDLTRPFLDAGTASWLGSVTAVDPKKNSNAKKHKDRKKKMVKGGRGGEDGGTASTSSLPLVGSVAAGVGAGASWPASRKRDMAVSTSIRTWLVLSGEKSF